MMSHDRNAAACMSTSSHRLSTRSGVPSGVWPRIMAWRSHSAASFLEQSECPRRLSRPRHISLDGFTDRPEVTWLRNQLVGRVDGYNLDASGDVRLPQRPRVDVLGRCEQEQVSLEP